MDFPHHEYSPHKSTEGLETVASRVSTLVRRGSLEAQIRRGVMPEHQWRSAIREMCEEARVASVPPERFLVEVKQALAILCDTCKVPHGPRRTDFTSRVVTLCIEEYYAASDN